MLRLLLVLVTCALLGLHSCSDSPGEEGAGQPARRVQHLDPRLKDGRSVADILAAKRVERKRFTLSGPQSVEQDLPGWTLLNARTLPPQRDRSGVHFRGIVNKETKKSVPVSLRYSTGIDTTLVNVIEVDMRAYSPGSAAVQWRTPGGAKGGFKGPKRSELALSDSRGIQTVRFFVGVNRNWFGKIPRLDIIPMSRGMQSFDIVEVRFVSLGYAFGPEPLPRTGPDAAGDGGLVGFEKRARRVWPGDLDVPMFATARVPLRGRVSARVALPAAMQRTKDELNFAIDARPTDSAEWQLVKQIAFIPFNANSEQPWHHLLGKLDAFGGQDIELRLRAWSSKQEVAGGSEVAGLGTEEPHNCRVWWGQPIVFGQPAEDRRPDIVLVTLDTTRTDVLGSYGGPKRTPNLDRLAEEGWQFEDAWSGCNSTLPSHTSILTGLDVPVHGVLDNRSVLSPELHTLASHLRAAGYLTAAAVSVEHLQSGYSGLGRGFDQFIDVQPGSVNNGSLTLDSVDQWISEWEEDGPHPIFLWVHLFDPHTPYGPPKSFMTKYMDEYDLELPAKHSEPSGVGPTPYTKKGQFLDGVTNADYASFLYEAGVSYSDQLFGRLRKRFETLGNEDGTLWLVTSDHGEALGEMDVWYNHAMLSKSVMNVPLIVRLPGAEANRSIGERVSTVEIAGSLARYLGLDPMGSGSSKLFDGQPLLADRRIWFSHSHKDQIGFRDSEVHFFENFNRPYGHLGKDRLQPLGKRYLYDTADDTECSTNLAESVERDTDGYSQLTHEWAKVMSTGLILKKNLTEEERKTLEGLGYGGGDE